MYGINCFYCTFLPLSAMSSFLFLITISTSTSLTSFPNNSRTISCPTQTTHSLDLIRYASIVVYLFSELSRSLLGNSLPATLIHSFLLLLWLLGFLGCIRLCLGLFCLGFPIISVNYHEIHDLATAHHSCLVMNTTMHKTVQGKYNFNTMQHNILFSVMVLFTNPFHFVRIHGPSTSSEVGATLSKGFKGLVFMLYISLTTDRYTMQIQAGVICSYIAPSIVVLFSTISPMKNQLTFSGSNRG